MSNPAAIFNKDVEISGNSNLIIKSGGNLGIGRTPSSQIDVSGSGEFSESLIVQKTKIGGNPNFSGAASFAHSSNNDGTNYSLLQSSGGKTFLNASSNQSITFRISHGEKMVLDKHGNIGIGTNSPSTKLDVDGSGNFSGNLTVSGTITGNVTGDLTGNASSATELETGRNIGGVLFDGTSDISLSGVNQTGNQNITKDNLTLTSSSGPIYFKSNTNDRMRILQNGNVGIGTTDPGEKLEVNGNLHLDNGNSVQDTAGARLIFDNAYNKRGPNKIALHVGNGGVGTTQDKYGFGVESSTVSYHTSTYHKFYSGVSYDGSNNASGTPNMTISSGNKVGIGKTPSTNLDVNGDVSFSGDLDVGGTITGNVTGDVSGNASSATELETGRNIGGVLFDGTSDISLSGVNQTGNQNITKNNLTLTSSSGPIYFKSNTNDRMRILQNGNVGIGTTDPGEKLQVNGIIKTNGLKGYTISSNFLFEDFNDTSRNIGVDSDGDDIAVANIFEMGNTYASGANFICDSNGNSIRSSVAPEGFAFYSRLGNSGDPRLLMYITGKDGNAGIRGNLVLGKEQKHNSSSYKLDVSGDGNFDGNIDLNENQIIDCRKINLKNGTHTGVLEAETDSIKLSGLSNLKFTINSNGTNDDGGEFQILKWSNSTPIVKVNQSSQMGIGKTPSKELDVSGDGNFSGDLDIGGTITGNGSGLSSLSASNITGTLSMDRITDGSITNTKLQNKLITIAGTNVSLGSSISASTLKNNLGLGTSNNVQFAKVGLGTTSNSGDFSLDTNSAMRIRATPVDQSYNNGPERGVLVLHSSAGIGSDDEGGNSNFSIEPSGNILTLSRHGGSYASHPLGCIFNLSRWQNDGNKSRSRLAFRLNHDGIQGDNESDYNTAMVICSNNSVGIGKTNPSTNLDVSGDGNFSGDLTIDGSLNINNGLKVYYDGTQNQILSSGNSLYLKTENGNNSQIQIQPAAVKVYSSKLVYGNGSTLTLTVVPGQLDISGDVTIADNKDLTVTGDIGIGTSPSLPLHIKKNGTHANETPQVRIEPSHVNSNDAGIDIIGKRSSNTAVPISYINFRNNDSDNNTTNYFGTICGRTINTTDNYGGLSLMTSTDGSLNNLTDRLFIDNYGNVGIGTTSPDEKLDVSGDLKLQNSSGGGIIYGKDRNHLISFRKSYDGTVTNVLDFHEYGKIRFFTNGYISTDERPAGNTDPIQTEKMCILSGGNVGIGTTNPGEKLEVSGIIKTNGLKGYTISSDFSFQDFDNTSQNIGVDASGNDIPVTNIFEMGNTNASGANFICESNGNAIRNSVAPEGFAFYGRGGTSSTFVPPHRLLMYITGHDGNVGIRGNLVLGKKQKHNSSSYKLDVDGDGNFDGNLNVGGKIIGNIEKNGSSLNIKTITSGTINIISAAAIDISSAGTVTITSGSSNPISFKTGAGSVERMKITNGGRVGIGISPSNLYMLDVNGDGNFRGDLDVTGDINISGQIYGDGSNLTNLPFSSLWSGSSDICYNSGNVGIGTTNPGEKLEVNGTVKATNYIATSDRNLKENIVQINNENIINKVTSLNGYNFNFKDDETKQTKSGLIAQEVEELMPELVSTNTDGNKSMDYNGMIPYLIECIKVQQNQINMLKAKIENM